MQNKALAFDIGGTKIYYALIDDKGTILSDVFRLETPNSANLIVDVLKSAISKYEEEIDLVAIATAGAVDLSNKRVISSTGNLPEKYNEIEFEKLFNKHVFVENDANSAAWAEYRIGASKGFDNSIMLTLGTGVGGGIILGGRLYRGKSGAAGEMHFKMSRDKKRQCTCGAYDCFEIYASGNGLKLTARELSGNNHLTSYDVISGVKNNDKLMLDVLDKWQEDISDGIIGLSNLFDPDCFVLSGSMAEFVNLKKIEDRVNSEIVTTPTKVFKASSGNYSGMQGVTVLAFEVLNGQI